MAEATAGIEARHTRSRRGRIKAIAKSTAARFFHPDTSLRCAGTAFFGFLSVFPAVAITLLVYGLVADRLMLLETVRGLDVLLPPDALGVVTDQLAMLVRQKPEALGAGLLVSIPVALWSGSRGIDALLYAMSSVRGEPRKRGFFKSLLIAVGLTIAGAVLLIVALVTVAGLPSITQLLPLPSLAQLLVLAVRWPILLAVSVAVLAALYRWGPDRHPRRFRYIWPGAVLASLLWVLAGIIFSVYVEQFGNFEASFGSVSAVVVLLLWMYNSAQVFVLGAAFNTAIEEQDRPMPAMRTEVPLSAPAPAG